MRKDKYFIINLFALMMVFCINISGCGSSEENIEKSNRATKAESSNTALGKDISTQESEVEMNSEDNTEFDTSIASGYYLSLGVLDTNVVRNGADRDESEVKISNDKVLFPQGAVRSIAINNWARRTESYSLNKEEVVHYLDTLESAEVVSEIPEKVLGKLAKIQVHVLYLNSHGEFRVINITDFGEGYQEISVAEDAENFSKNVPITSDKEKKESVFIHSNDSENILREWMQWEDIGEKGFSSIKSVSVITEKGKEELDEERLNLLKSYLTSNKKKIESPCGYEAHFESLLEDGTTFHFSISADGTCMSTDKEAYEIDGSVSGEMLNWIKEII